MKQNVTYVQNQLMGFDTNVKNVLILIYVRHAMLKILILIQQKKAINFKSIESL